MVTTGSQVIIAAYNQLEKEPQAGDAKSEIDDVAKQKLEHGRGVASIGGQAEVGIDDGIAKEGDHNLGADLQNEGG